MSVEITPTGQLGFTRPLTRLVTQTIKIHNPNSAPVAFKVKTTAPKQYCVRPNSGRVESGESVEVQVLLQPLATEPPPHAKCKDKFLVQSAFIAPDEEMHTLAEMWAQTERTNKSAIHEQKIKSVYLAPEDGSHVNGIREEEEGELGESRVMDDSGLGYQAFKTPATPQRHTQEGFQEGMSKWTVEQDKEYDSRLFRNGGHSYWETSQLPYVPPVPKDKVKQDEGKLGAIFTAAQSSPHGATPASPSGLAAPIPATAQQPAAAAPTLRDAPAAAPAAGLPASDSTSSPSTLDQTNPDLARALNHAYSDSEKVRVLLAEVIRLQGEKESGASGAGTNGSADGPQVTGLRRRGGGSVAQQAGEKAEVAVAKAKEAVQQGASQGVPLEVVVGLVVGTFVMAYLFF